MRLHEKPAQRGDKGTLNVSASIDDFCVAVVQDVVTELRRKPGRNRRGDEKLGRIHSESAIEFARGDTYDGRRLSVKMNRLSDCVRIGGGWASSGR
jgi:hypothetical protein